MVDNAEMSVALIEDLRSSDHFSTLLRVDLIEQLEMLEEDADASSWKLREAFNRIIAFYSVPGTYKDGHWDE